MRNYFWLLTFLSFFLISCGLSDSKPIATNSIAPFSSRALTSTYTPSTTFTPSPTSSSTPTHTLIPTVTPTLTQNKTATQNAIETQKVLETALTIQVQLAEFDQHLSESGITLPEELTSTGQVMGKIRISLELADMGGVSVLQFNQDITDQLLVNTLMPFALQQAYTYDNPDFARVKQTIDEVMAMGINDFRWFYPVATDLVNIISFGHNIPIELTNIKFTGPRDYIPEHMRNTIHGSISKVNISLVTTSEFDAAISHLGEDKLSNSILYDHMECSFGTCYIRSKSLYTIINNTLHILRADLKMDRYKSSDEYDWNPWETTFYPSEPSLNNRIMGLVSEINNIAEIARLMGVPVEKFSSSPIANTLTYGTRLQWYSCEAGDLCKGLLFQVIQK